MKDNLELAIQAVSEAENLLIITDDILTRYAGVDTEYIKQRIFDDFKIYINFIGHKRLALNENDFEKFTTSVNNADYSRMDMLAQICGTKKSSFLYLESADTLLVSHYYKRVKKRGRGDVIGDYMTYRFNYDKVCQYCGKNSIWTRSILDTESDYKCECGGIRKLCALTDNTKVDYSGFSNFETWLSKQWLQNSKVTILGIGNVLSTVANYMRRIKFSEGILIDSNEEINDFYNDIKDKVNFVNVRADDFISIAFAKINKTTNLAQSDEQTSNKLRLDIMPSDKQADNRFALPQDIENKLYKVLQLDEEIIEEFKRRNKRWATNSPLRILYGLGNNTYYLFPLVSTIVFKLSDSIKKPIDDCILFDDIEVAIDFQSASTEPIQSLLDGLDNTTMPHLRKLADFLLMFRNHLKEGYISDYNIWYRYPSCIYINPKLSYEQELRAKMDIYKTFHEINPNTILCNKDKNLAFVRFDIMNQNT